MQPLPVPLKELLQRIEAKTEKTASCWLWQGPVKSGTTPILRIPHSKKVVSPRRVLVLSSGIEIPPGFRIFPAKEVCKQLVCIRPEHMQVAKGIWPETVKKFRPPRQYSEAMVHEACELYYEGKTQREVAALTGIEYSMVSRLVRGLRHGDVTKVPRSPGKVFTSGTIKATSGEKSPFAKITEEMAQKIIVLAEEGHSPQAISEAIGCSLRIVRHILNGDAWRWLTKRRIPVAAIVNSQTKDGAHRPIGEQHRRAILTNEKVLIIVSLWNKGGRITDIAREVESTFNAVYGVLRGNSWAWLTGIQPNSRPVKLLDSYPDEALVIQHWTHTPTISKP